MIYSMNARLSQLDLPLRRGYSATLKRLRFVAAAGAVLACAPASPAPAVQKTSAAEASEAKPPSAEVARPEGSPATSNSSCHSLPQCSEAPCTRGAECYRLASCTEPVCVVHQVACEIDCGGSECERLKSLPLQVACPEGPSKAANASTESEKEATP